MQVADVITGIWWWLGLITLGWVSLPFTWRIFSKLSDGGYTLSKIITLATVGYAVWLLVSLHLLPFSRWLILAILVGWGIINWCYLRPNWSWKKYWKIIVFEEVVFALVFFFWLFIRAHQNAIFGLEKYMDFGFINSILRSDFFPPRDPWFTPEDINYYYFGHFLAALLIKLANIFPAVGYNMVLSTILALSVSAAFCLGLNIAALAKAELGKSWTGLVSGFLAVALVVFAGNLHTIYLFTQGYSQSPPPFWEIWYSFNPDQYWYPNATRFIPNTIHEFPSYSWVVADLHGHVLDIPFVLATLLLLLVIFYQKKILFWQGILLSLLLAIMYMTNAVDSLVYLALFIAIALVMLIKTNSSAWLVTCALVILLAIFLMLPFQANFTPFTSGLGLVRDRSSWWMMLVLWGFFYWQIVALAIITKRHWQELWQKLDVGIWVVILAVLSTGLIVFPEVFYIKDIYPVHYRANTMFKLGYQAFIMLGVVSTYVIIKLLPNLKWPGRGLRVMPAVYIAITAAGLLLVLSYPYFAIKSYYNNLRDYQGLDGLLYLKKSHPSDYLAIAWMNDNIVGQPTIVEASGDSYTEFARVSANSGLATIIGWPVHEWLWRKNDKAPFARQAEVDQIYTTDDLAQSRSILDKYNVEYIFWGDLEKQKYASVNPAKFDKLAAIVYQNGTTALYKVNR
ncbi:hypothetical protein HY388_00350 [Candidatus Daviesbacteria bacterium]|nr:hypothetical protein [Candidatus Daviesbacteria bacterium]